VHVGGTVQRIRLDRANNMSRREHVETALSRPSSLRAIAWYLGCCGSTAPRSFRTLLYPFSSVKITSW
jgi:hypothetical protein